MIFHCPAQFFSDVREAEEHLQKLQETLRRKYSCDRSITVTRLEDLLQDAQVRQRQEGGWLGVWAALVPRTLGMEDQQRLGRSDVGGGCVMS